MTQLEKENKRLKEEVKQHKAERAMIFEHVAKCLEAQAKWFRMQIKMDAYFDNMDMIPMDMIPFDKH